MRCWLTLHPEKILFVTDTFPGTPEIDWEEVGWLTATGGRRALASPLTAMTRDGEITRGSAPEIARLVVRENAAKLYGIG